MRRISLVVAVACLALGSLVLGAHTTARGEEGDEASQVEALQKQVEALELQVEYLLAREADLTKYLLAGEERGAALQTMVRSMRTQGFEARAIPVDSRVTLTRGLEALGASLAEELPAVTKAQAALLRQARSR